MGRTTHVAAGLSAVFLAASTAATERQDLGRSEKFRVLVDKVLMAHNEWVMTEDHVREIAAAGFNVVSPRLGNDDMDEVRRIARLAQKHGMFHMPWMRGTFVADDCQKLTWSGGTVQELCSPNADELWDWKAGRILEYARIGREIPSLIGVFLDYENYWEGKQGWNGYPLSYDEGILAEFARAEDLELPALVPEERYPWVVEQGLHEAFRRFQHDHWRQRCRALRRAVDEIDPTFQFCVYPAPGTAFATEAIVPEWGTEAAPLILADASIYGRPPSMLPNPFLRFEPDMMSHAGALAGNRDMLQRRFESVRHRGYPLMYMGGLDPVVFGADPEFSGKNAVMSAEVTDGYWIFYEGPKYDGEHPDYFEWFTWANEAIAGGRFEVQHEPRRTPDAFGGTEVLKQSERPQVGLLRVRSAMVDRLTERGHVEAHLLRSAEVDYLRQLDAVVIGSFTAPLDFDSEFVQRLREYVTEGGALMLGHDTAWYANPFPEIALPAAPSRNGEAGRHVVRTDLRVRPEMATVGDVDAGTEFATAYWDHSVFTPGPRGTVVVENTHGDPVYVVGTFGEGRVVFAGTYFRHHPFEEGAETAVLEACLAWLVGG